MIALLNGISSTCNQRRRPLRPISDNNCERITRSIKQKGPLCVSVIPCVPQCAMRFRRNSPIRWKFPANGNLNFFWTTSSQRATSTSGNLVEFHHLFSTPSGLPKRARIDDKRNSLNSDPCLRWVQTVKLFGHNSEQTETILNLF